MEIKKLFRKVFPNEISNLIQSYLIDKKINKIDRKKLFCKKCGKEYFGNKYNDLEKDQDLCPCYISWLYFSTDYENPWIN
mgnify:CR=1 FL=1